MQGQPFTRRDRHPSMRQLWSEYSSVSVPRCPLSLGGSHSAWSWGGTKVEKRRGKGEGKKRGFNPSYLVASMGQKLSINVVR